MFHLISLICLRDNGDKDRFTNCTEDCCTLPVRVVSYGLLFETQLFFLFLDTSSPFRGTYYEILMILSTFFGLSAIEEVARRCCGMDEDDDEADIDLEVIWQGILRLFIVIEAPIVMLTGVVYASQSLTDRSSLKTYDFAIYIITLITYGSGLVALFFSLLCSLYLCAESSKDEKFNHVMYKDINLSHIGGKSSNDYSRQVLRAIFSVEELSSSILPLGCQQFIRKPLDSGRFDFLHDM
ncbi:unnamed protein product [Rotaria magnacalcarata]|uniref:Uncharacterized protein n=1 Tax=Rotaria magnacalcarata TaxID=392030 RepID=A0A8S2QQI2_9BILA|nr:unnamed protein product [Rotaria magnacalcarata]